MNQEKMVLTVAYAVAAIALLTGAVAVLPASAADGDIIIGRDVQTRVATRKELVPDPNPQLVNPKPNAAIETGLRGGRLMGELGDSEFAAVSSGTRLTTQLLGGQVPSFDQGSAFNNQHPGMSGHNSVGHSGGRTLGGVGSQINRSVQVGLRPLQNLQR